MTERSRYLDWARLVTGLAVLAIGAGLLLDQSNLLRGVRFFELWPLIVIAVGVTRATDGGDNERRRGGLTVAFIGCWLLVASLELFGLDYGDSWPLALVAVGLAVLLTARSGPDWAKSLFLLALGAWFLISNNGYFGITLKQTWPVAVVALGLWIAAGAFFTRGRQRYCRSCRTSECSCIEAKSGQEA